MTVDPPRPLLLPGQDDVVGSLVLGLAQDLVGLHNFVVAVFLLIFFAGVVEEAFALAAVVDRLTVGVELEMELQSFKAQAIEHDRYYLFCLLQICILDLLCCRITLDAEHLVMRVANHGTERIKSYCLYYKLK